MFLLIGLPAGFFAEWFGGKLVTSIALIVSFFMTALTPIMADWSVWAVYTNRIVIGLAGVGFKLCLKLSISFIKIL